MTTPGSFPPFLEDFQFRLGEDTPVHPGAELVAARRFRDVLGLFASGVTIITSVHDGEPVGMTCQSFTSVSLAPPLVLFCPARTSRAWPLIERAGFFCANILSADQATLSERFASKGAEKYAGVAWSTAATGAPVLDGALGYVDCRIDAVHQAGDHLVVIGRVVELGGGGPGGPLLYYGGRYTRVSPDPTPGP